VELMSEDAELLRRYATEHSEPAFAELVQRHVNLVYSAALRLSNGNIHRAEDVTQQVFAELARQAKRLSHHPVLTGWLYTTTRLMTLRLLRTEQRRQAREQEANVMNETLREPASPPDWEHLRPVLEDAMHQLDERDRLAVLLRYFQNKSLKEIGASLNLNENAARMRVDRALERLRLQLARKGVTSTMSALALTLTGNAVTAAPPAFAATVATASLASAAAETGTTFVLLKIMALTKTQIGIGALLITGAAITLMIQQRSHAELREENSLLQRQVVQLQSDNDDLSRRFAEAKTRPALRLPAPRVAAMAAPVPADELRSTNLYGRLKDYNAKLSAAQVAPYLNANHRSPASLLAAYRSTGDVALLEEAMQKFPDDPQVAFEAMHKKDAPAEERRPWLDAMKRFAPENALPNYLSALDYFKSGQADQAVQELIAAHGKQSFEDYTSERIQNDEDAYLAAGFPAAEAKTIPAQQLLLPQLAQIKELSGYVVELAKSYREAGDPSSAQAALQMLANLGQRYSGTRPGEPEVSQLVGMAVERIALSEMEPAGAYGTSGQTVLERLNQLAEQKRMLLALNQQFEPLQPMMTDHDWISYKDRWRIFGEEAALKWVIGKYGRNNPAGSPAQ
jgi:RNA polymerase sigma factor (sigma-70 family)